jgi:hypothetical protein
MNQITIFTDATTVKTAGENTSYCLYVSFAQADTLYAQASLNTTSKEV